MNCPSKEMLTPVEVVPVPEHELVGEHVVRHHREDVRAPPQPPLPAGDALAQAAVGHPATGG